MDSVYHKINNINVNGNKWFLNNFIATLLKYIVMFSFPIWRNLIASKILNFYRHLIYSATILQNIIFSEIVN